MESIQHVGVLPGFELQFDRDQLEDLRFYYCGLNEPRSAGTHLDSVKALGIILLQYAATFPGTGVRFVLRCSARNSHGRTLANALVADASPLKELFECNGNSLGDVLFPPSRPCANRAGKNADNPIVLWINDGFLASSSVRVLVRNRGKVSQIKSPDALLLLAHSIWKTEPFEWTHDDPLSGDREYEAETTMVDAEGIRQEKIPSLEPADTPDRPWSSVLARLVPVGSAIVGFLAYPLSEPIRSPAAAQLATFVHKIKGLAERPEDNGVRVVGTVTVRRL